MTTGNTKQHRAVSDEGSDKGSALIMVMIGMTILAMFATVALTYATNTLKVTRHSQDLITSLAAAQGGVDEYLARLNKDDTYWQKGLDCTNPAMRRPMPAASNTCGWTPTTPVGWAVLPGVDTASFHYDVDPTATPVNGTIALTVTGKASKLNRTITVGLRRAGFGEFLYYTDYETIDPTNEAVYGRDNKVALDKCAHYFWEATTPTSKPRDTSVCADIVFTSGDVLNGPIHSNDAIKMSGTNPGPIFMGNASTSWPNCRPLNGVSKPPSACFRNNGGATPVFNKGITYKDLIDLPTSIGSLGEYVDPAKTTPAGCLYTGPTRIKILAPAVVGGLSKMKVWSKYSDPLKPLNPGCGDSTAPWPQTMDIPNNNIIIVQNVPQAQNLPKTGSCAVGAIGDGFPQALDVSERLLEADCRYGNVYIEGVLAGKLSISADNNIIITDHLKYNSGTNGADVLGLIASNSVKIYHPTSCPDWEFDSKGNCRGTQNNNEPKNMNRPNGTKFTDPVIQAAILTLQHSFTVQYYQTGSKLGDIHLFGSFAQRYRGPVGTSGGTGYFKAYVYDTRLRYAPPPYFLDPIHAAWGVKTFGELAAEYQGL